MARFATIVSEGVGVVAAVLLFLVRPPFAREAACSIPLEVLAVGVAAGSGFAGSTRTKASADGGGDVFAFGAILAMGSVPEAGASFSRYRS